MDVVSVSTLEMESWFQSAHDSLKHLKDIGASCPVVVRIATQIVSEIAAQTWDDNCCKLLKVAIHSPIGRYCDPDIVLANSSLAKEAACNLSTETFKLVAESFRPHYTICTSSNLNSEGGEECSCTDHYPGIIDRYGNTVNYFPLCFTVDEDFFVEKLDVLHHLCPKVTKLFLFRYAALFPINAHIEDKNGIVAKYLGSSNFDIPTKYLLLHSENKACRTSSAQNLQVLLPHIWAAYRDAMDTGKHTVPKGYTDVYHTLVSKIRAVKKMSTVENYAQKTLDYMEAHGSSPVEKLILFVSVLCNTQRVVTNKLLQKNNTKLSNFIRESYHVIKHIYMYDEQHGNPKRKSAEFLLLAYSNVLRVLIVHTSFDLVFSNLEKLNMDTCVHAPMTNLVALCMMNVITSHVQSSMRSTCGVKTVTSIFQNPQCFELQAIVKNVIPKRLHHNTGYSIIKFLDTYLDHSQIKKLLQCRDSKKRNLLHHLVTSISITAESEMSLCIWCIRHNSALLCQEDCLHASPMSYQHDEDLMIE